jgi:hypothetical protein
MIVAMSEPTTSSSEPATGPVTTTAPPPYVAEKPAHRSRLSAAAAWVGIGAGVVFIVAVVFFSGFVLGKSAGGHGGGHRGGGDRDLMMIHRGPPPGFPMGPRGEFERPGPFGPGGPGGMQPPNAPNAPSAPGAPTTTPARP